MHTSVPRWPTSDPGIDRSGQTFAVVWFGPAAAPIAAGWCADIKTLGRPFQEFPYADGFANHLEHTTVGWRLLLTGPQADVLQVRALAVEHGAIDAEITIVVTEDRQRRVRCAHCTAITLTGSTPMQCEGCGRTLDVHEHVSRRHAAYLGVAAG